MFTGIVETTGNMLSLQRRRKRSVLRIGIPLRMRKGLGKGESLAVNGVCLTVRTLGKSWVECDLLGETLRRTNLGEIATGSRVNLERCLKALGRVGGHFVTGHVDTTGKVLQAMQRGADRILTVGYPERFSKYLVQKGSIAIDGVSLTIVQARKGYFTVHLIPHTLKTTTLGAYRVGAKLNLEFDIMAKYLLSWFLVKG